MRDAEQPTSLTAQRSENMRRVKRVDTAPERRLRSLLHARGMRFRKDLLLRLGESRIRPDVVFTRARVAVFVDGCFWHRCPEHGTSPKTNTGYWKPKLDRNVQRDRRNDEQLQAAGWTVIRVWEHEDPQSAADRIEAAVALGRQPTVSRLRNREGTAPLDVTHRRYGRDRT